MTTEDPKPVGGDEERTSTPLDHPLFLPVLFAACAVWFGYDGYLNDSPEMREHQAFNRHGFHLLVFLTAHWGYRGLCETAHRRENPWVLPAILAGMAAWIGFDGWWSQDAFNLENAPFFRAIFPWLAFASGWYALGAVRRSAGSRPRFSFAIVMAAPALGFAYRGLVTEAGEPEAIMWLGGAAIAAVFAIWSFVSELRHSR